MNKKRIISLIGGILLILVIFFISFSIQSCSKKRNVYQFEGGKTIPIAYNPDNFSPLDAFISDIKIVPLETNDNCLIGNRLHGVKVHQDLIYINSSMNHLLVFDLNGEFMREIGKRGQGPGEFQVINDFIFTDEGTIEILDFRKIESYNMEGKHIGTVKRFDFNGKDLYLNPDNFCRSFSSGYYLWGGVMGLRDERLREKSSMMYRVNNEMQIDNAYFDTKYGDGGHKERFKHYQDKILITASPLDYNVYQIDSNDSISIRYTFNFGKYGFDINKDMDRKTIDYKSYIYGMNEFQETDRFLYFWFKYQNRGVLSLLYSKSTEQAFFQSFVPSDNGKEIRLFPPKATHHDRLIAIVEVFALKLDLERMSSENIKKWGLEAFHKLDDEDNPVLIFYNVK